MNKTFKKIAASIMAVTSLAVSMSGMSASAVVTPRVGGSDGFSINGASVTTSIDVIKSYAAASTRCTLAQKVTVSVNAYNTDNSTVYQYKEDDDHDGYASVYITPSVGQKFKNATSYHTATYNGATGSKSMYVNAP